MELVVTPELLESLKTPFSYVGEGCMVIGGKDANGKTVIYRAGNIPECDVRNVKRLYNKGWSAVRLSQLFDVNKKVILNLLQTPNN